MALGTLESMVSGRSGGSDAERTPKNGARAAPFAGNWFFFSLHFLGFFFPGCECLNFARPGVVAIYSFVHD